MQHYMYSIHWYNMYKTLYSIYELWSGGGGGTHKFIKIAYEWTNILFLTLTECYFLLLAEPRRQRFQPCQLKKVRFVKWYMYSYTHKRQRCKPVSSPGVIATPAKNLRYVPLRCHFLHFEITVNGKIVAFLTGSGSQGQLALITAVHYRARSYRRLMLGYQKGKNGWETTEKQQRIVFKHTG